MWGWLVIFIKERETGASICRGRSDTFFIWIDDTKLKCNPFSRHKICPLVVYLWLFSLTKLVHITMDPTVQWMDHELHPYVGGTHLILNPTAFLSKHFDVRVGMISVRLVTASPYLFYLLYMKYFFFYLWQTNLRDFMLNVSTALLFIPVGWVRLWTLTHQCEVTERTALYLKGWDNKQNSTFSLCLVLMKSSLEIVL